MKRLILFRFPIFTVISAAKAQAFKVGVVAGIAITDVDGFNPNGNGDDFRKFGPIIGGSVSTKLGVKSTLQMEITYTQRGSAWPPDSTNNNNYYRFSLDYIDVTILWKRQLHLGVNKKPTDKLGFEAGVTLGTLFTYLYTSKSIVYPITGLNTFDAGVLVGIYYNFSPKFYFSGTYGNSFIPVIPHDGFPAGSYGLFYSSWNKGENLAFQLTFGLKFGSNSEDKVSNAPVAPPPAPVGGN